MMSMIVLAAMAGLAMQGTPIALDHQAEVAHRSGPAQATYRGTVTIAHQQVGAAGPGGRASTLRCRWTAGLTVDRAAAHATGRFARTVATGPVIEGSRPGWCETHRAAIGREVARREGELRGHLVALAREDHAVLGQELDRAAEASRTG